MIESYFIQQRFVYHPSFSVATRRIYTFEAEMSVSKITVENGGRKFHFLGEYIRYDESGGKVNRIFCVLCDRHKESLRSIRNFNRTFVDGVTGMALKKDNVVKHSHTDTHSTALNIERQRSASLNNITS